MVSHRTRILLSLYTRSVVSLVKCVYSYNINVFEDFMYGNNSKGKKSTSLIPSLDTSSNRHRSIDLTPSCSPKLESDRPVEVGWTMVGRHGRVKRGG